MFPGMIATFFHDRPGPASSHVAHCQIHLDDLEQIGTIYPRGRVGSPLQIGVRDVP